VGEGVGARGACVGVIGVVGIGVCVGVWVDVTACGKDCTAANNGGANIRRASGGNDLSCLDGIYSVNR
jgi:hypothetical protein